MSTKIEYRIEFEHGKKAIAVQGVLGGCGSLTVIDKRLSVEHKEDFDRIYGALDEFNAMAYQLIVREYRADKVADTIRKCKGE